LLKDRNDVSLKASIEADPSGQNARSRHARSAWLLAALGVLGITLAGCSVSMPMASLMPDRHDDDSTGAIPTPQVAGWLDPDDWQTAKPAFNQALEQKSPSPMAWDNPKSGAKGSFIADGEAYPGVSGTCRAFHAEIERDSNGRALEGTACAEKTGVWQVTQIKVSDKS
jgi:surface antigen